MENYYLPVGEVKPINKDGKKGAHLLDSGGLIEKQRIKQSTITC